jgi:hypothetical protein
MAEIQTWARSRWPGCWGCKVWRLKCAPRRISWAAKPFQTLQPYRGTLFRGKGSRDLKAVANDGFMEDYLAEPLTLGEAPA